MDDDEDEVFPALPGYTAYPADGTNSTNGTNTNETLDFERHLNPQETTIERCKRLLRENVDGAALELIHIAKHGSTEKLRLDACKLIMDRVLGPVANVQADSNDNPLEQLFRELDQVQNG
jgi:hypothetical protein